MPGSVDSYVPIAREDYSYLRVLANSVSGSAAVMSGATAPGINRLVDLELVMLSGGRVFITGRGMCAVEAEPVSTTDGVLSFRSRDLMGGRPNGAWPARSVESQGPRHVLADVPE